MPGILGHCVGGGLRDWMAFKLTLGLIGLCIVVAIVTRLGEDVSRLDSLWIDNSDGSSGLFSDVLHGQAWRLFTPMLIHFGPAHLIFNMSWLWGLGRAMEAREGSAKYALIVGVMGVGSSALQYGVTGDPYFGGMSGVAYGLIGYFWARGQFQPTSGYHLARRDLLIALAWFVACWAGLLGNIANWAHTGGLALGVALGYFDARGGDVRRA